MAEGFQVFEFTTKQIPQVQGTDGAHWEKLPIASFPPTLDISVPDSTANAVAAAMSNIAQSFGNLNNTLQNVTQQVQNAACSINDLIDSLKTAQNFAKQFADGNNGTNIYVRQIGLDPVGTVNSQQLFISKVRGILSDTGTDVGQIPLVVPAEIPLDPVKIADTLRAGGTLLDSAVGGSTQLGGFLGGELSKIGVTASAGMGLGELSNNINFEPPSQGGGFSSSTISYNVISIIKIDATTAQATFETGNTVQQNFTIQGSTKISNNGSFKVDANGVDQITSLGKTLTRVKYQNPSVLTETSSQATIIFQGTTAISAADTIRAALEQDGYYGQKVAKKSIPVTQLLETLVNHNIVGVNPNFEDKDKSIALERLTRLTSANSQRIGGVVLVGRAPNLASLSRKLQALANVMEWLKPLSDKLAFSALASATSSPSGIDFDPTNIDLNQLSSQQNVAKQDIASAKQKVKDSGVTDTEDPVLQVNSDNPDNTNFNAWRHYRPVQLIPSLLDAAGFSTASSVASGQAEQEAFAPVQSAVGGAIAGATGSLAKLIQDGKDGLDSGLTSLTAQGNAIDGIVDSMNALNKKMVDGLNFLKNQIGVGPISVDAHLIGPKLTLQSNSQYGDALQAALNDFTDPNRPTFGPAASTNVLENQNTLNAALQGVAPPTVSTTLWFGIVLVVVGQNRQDLGDQLRTLAGLLSMDDSVIDLPPKKKVTFSGFKI